MCALKHAWVSVYTLVWIWQGNHGSQSCSPALISYLPPARTYATPQHLLMTPSEGHLLPYLLVLLERNRASGLMLPMARVPVFLAVIPQRPQAPTIHLQVLS